MLRLRGINAVKRACMQHNNTHALATNAHLQTSIEDNAHLSDIVEVQQVTSRFSGHN